MADPLALSESILKTLSPSLLIDRGYCADVNNVSEAGVYRLDIASMNKPGPYYGMLIHLVTDGGICQVDFYIGFSVLESKFDYRMRMNWAGTSSNWISLL